MSGLPDPSDPKCPLLYRRQHLVVSHGSEAGPSTQWPKLPRERTWSPRLAPNRREVDACLILYEARAPAP